VQSAPHLRLLTWEGSDSELLDLVASGDDAAAARFHDRFGSSVHALVRALLGPDVGHGPGAGQERLVERSLLSAYASLYDRTTSVAELPARVERHTVKIVRAHLRSRRWSWRDRRRAISESELDEEVLAFYGRIAQLAPDLRISFCLRYVVGKALSETARLCDCSLTEVRERLARAEAYLRTMADDELFCQFADVDWES